MENNDNLSQRQYKNTTKFYKCQAIFINLVKESFSLVKELVKERSLRFGLQFGLRTPTFLVYDTALARLRIIHFANPIIKFAYPTI